MTPGIFTQVKVSPHNTSSKYLITYPASKYLSPSRLIEETDVSGMDKNFEYLKSVCVYQIQQF